MITQDALVRYRDRLWQVDMVVAQHSDEQPEVMMHEFGPRYPSTHWVRESEVQPVSEQEDRRLRPGRYKGRSNAKPASGGQA